MEKALSIVELRDLVASFLCHRDLYLCTLVSKAWQETFEPWLCQTIRVGSRGRMMFSNPGAIRRIAHFIHSLDFNGIKMTLEDIDCFSSCTRLRELTIRDKYHMCRNELDPLSLFLIARNASTLQTLCCRRSHSQRILSVEIMKTIANCSRLSTLQLHNTALSFDSATQISFSLLISRLKALTLNDVDFPEEFSWPENVSFPLLERLEVICAVHSSRTQIIPIARRSPNLKVFDIKGRIAPLFRGLSKEVIPFCLQIEVLSLNQDRRCTRARHEIVNTILSRRAKQNSPNSPPLKWVDFPIGSDRQSHYQATRFFEHLDKMNVFATLEAINFKNCVWVTGSHIQRVLCSCVNLRAFRADQIYAFDIEHSPPWVCHQLEYFNVMISHGKMRDVYSDTEDSMDPDTSPASTSSLPTNGHEGSSHAIFKRLAQLRQLRVLDISYRSTFHQDQPHYVQGMCFRLESGLDLLKPLKRLQHIGFLEILPAPREEDIMFMINTWPNLQTICGKVHVNKQEDQEHVSQFSKRYGIHSNNSPLSPLKYIVNRYY